MDGQLVARKLEALATRQHGAVCVAQLYELGLTGDWVERRERAGWMHRVHRGVYAVGHPRLTERGKWMAAVLAVGDGGFLSHDSAASLWRLRPWEAGPIHVTVPTAGGRGHGLVIHRRPGVTDEDRTSRDGIPVASVELTLIDIAARVSRRPLERAVDEADRLGFTTERRLRRALVRNGGRRGVARLGIVVREHAIGSTATRSELEERFLRLCRQHRLPQPLVNAPLHDLTVDFLWSAERVVVEVDGHGSHGTRRAFQDDRDRDSLLAAHGYQTLRFTWRDVTRRPGVVMHRVRQTLNRLADRRVIPAGRG